MKKVENVLKPQHNTTDKNITKSKVHVKRAPINLNQINNITNKNDLI